MLGLAPDGRLAALGVIRRGEDLCEVECDACGDRHIEHVQVIIEPPGSTPRMYIGCKEAGRVRVEPERLEVQRIDFDGLARAITTVLGLGNSPRGIIDGCLWLLGSSRFGGWMRDVFLARGTSWPDGRALAGNARLVTSPCPVILLPHLLPNDSVWTGNGRIMLSMSEFDWFGDDSPDVLRRITAMVAEHDRRTPAVEEALFRKDGEIWTVSFDGKTVHVGDLVGMGYIAEL